MNVNSPMHDLDARKRLSNVCWSRTSRLLSEDTLDILSRCSYCNGQSESLLTGSDDYGHIVMRHGRWLCALCVYVLRDIHKRIYRMILVASVIPLTYLCQDVNRQICEYHTVLKSVVWTGNDEHLRRISGFTRNFHAIHTIKKTIIQPSRWIIKQITISWSSGHGHSNPTLDSTIS